MARAFSKHTVVLPGNPINVILVEEEAQEEPEKRISFAEFLANMPPREPLFKTAEEVDQYIQAERDSWD